MSTPSTIAAVTRRRQILVLVACCLSLFVVGIDVTAVNLALPAIRADLHGTVSEQQWMVSSYTLVLAAVMISAGAIGDRFGRKRIFLLGLVIFGVGSIVCAVAGDPMILIIGRAVQGVGGAMLNPMALAVIRVAFTDDAGRARAIGIWSAMFPVSMAFGPIVGGALISGFGWQSVFWLNVPVVVLAAIVIVALIPESKDPRESHLDPVGQVLIAVMFGSFVFLVVEGPAKLPPLGWGAASVVLIAAVVGYWRHYRKSSGPIVDLSLFRFAAFRGAVASTFFGYMGFGIFLFFNALYLESVRGFTPLESGLMTLPLALTTGAAGVLAGRFVASRGPRGALLIAGTLIVVGSAMLFGINSDTPLWLLALSYACTGVGFGALGPPATTTIMNALPPSRAGAAAGLLSSIRQAGQSIGVAALGAAGFSWWWLVALTGLIVLATTQPTLKKSTQTPTS